MSSPSSAVLTERRDAGAGLLLVGIDVPAAAARAYTTPGQYIEVRAAAGSGYFVLASDVGKQPWELLVKNAGDAADALVSLPIGSALDVVGPLGLGFPITDARARPVVVAVVGSALAVARPVIGLRVAQGVASSTTLFLGVRSAREVPLADEVAAWSELGVHVVLCVSRAEAEGDAERLSRARREVGYVQNVFARAVTTGEVAAGPLVVAAGPDAMLVEMRAVAARSNAASQAPPASQAGPEPGAPDEAMAALPIEVLTNV